MCQSRPKHEVIENSLYVRLSEQIAVSSDFVRKKIFWLFSHRQSSITPFVAPMPSETVPIRIFKFRPTNFWFFNFCFSQEVSSVCWLRWLWTWVGVMMPLLISDVVALVTQVIMELCSSTIAQRWFRATLIRKHFGTQARQAILRQRKNFTTHRFGTQQSQNRSQQVFNVSNFHKWFIFGWTFCETDCHNFATHCHFAQCWPAVRTCFGRWEIASGLYFIIIVSKDTLKMLHFCANIDCGYSPRQQTINNCRVRKPITIGLTLRCCCFTLATSWFWFFFLHSMCTHHHATHTHTKRFLQTFQQKTLAR